MDLRSEVPFADVWERGVGDCDVAFCFPDGEGGVGDVPCVFWAVDELL